MPEIRIEDASDDQIGRYLVVCVKTIAAITDAICLLIVRQVDPQTPAQELRIIEFELADLKAKRNRVSAQMTAVVANQRAMRPPSAEQMSSAKDLAKELDSMVAANIQAVQAIQTATQIFKLWQETEAA